MIGWQARVFAVPEWFDQSVLLSNVALGATVVPVSTVGKDYDIGGYAILWQNEFNCEIVDIDTITTTQLNLVRPTNSAWNANTTRVVPARLGRINNNINVKLITKTLQIPTVNWELNPAQQSANRLVSESLPTYRSYPIQLRKTNALEDQQTFTHKVAVADSRTGVKYYDAQSKAHRREQPYSIVTRNRTDLGQVLNFLYSLKGQFGAFWLPTWEFDMQLDQASIASNASTFNIKNIGYARYRYATQSQIDIMILLNNGTKYYRRITGATEAVDGSYETINIDSSLGVLVNATDINRISFLKLVRLESDKFSMTWQNLLGVAVFDVNLKDTNE